MRCFAVTIGLIHAHIIDQTVPINKNNFVLMNPPINTEGTCNEEGNLSLWSDWKQTSDCCSGPVKNRIYYQRDCLKTDCQCLGSSQAYVNCGVNACKPKTPVFCYWTGWSEWYANAENDVAYRSCQTNLVDKTCCEGSSTKTRAISVSAPTSGPIWGEWGSWTTCVGQIQIRAAECLSANEKLCQGTLSERRDCDKPFIIWGAWGSWTNCINESKSRTRPCEANDAFYCQGPLTATYPCQEPVTLPPTTAQPDLSNCSYSNKMSLNLCLNYNFGCRAWYNNEHVMAARVCFSSWRFTEPKNQYKIDQFYAVLGGYVY